MLSASNPRAPQRGLWDNPCHGKPAEVIFPRVIYRPISEADAWIE
jgi:hypothetical protein